MKPSAPSHFNGSGLLATTLLLFASASAGRAVDGSWVSTASGTQLWSNPANWSSSPLVAEGPGSDIWIKSNITTTTTLDLEGTSRVVGAVEIGDAAGTSSFIITGGAGSLIFEREGGASFTMSQGGNAIISAGITLNSDVTLRNELSGYNLTVSGKITGSGGVIQEGDGRVYLSNNNNDYTGGYTLTSGTLAFGNGAVLGSGALTLRGGVLENTATNVRTITNAVAMSGTVTKTGTAALTFSDAVTLEGDVVINTVERLDILGDFVGSYSVTKRGEGMLNLRSASRSYAGTFILDGGVVQATNANSFGSGTLRLLSGAWVGGESGVVTFNNAVEIGGTFSIGSTAMPEQERGITLTGDTTLIADSTLDVVAAGGAHLQGEISGNHGLAKTGAHLLKISGTNSYTGATVVHAGRLEVDGSIASSSGVEVASGATLAGHGTVSAISGAGTVNPGNSPGILTAESVDGSAGLDFVFEFTAAPGSGISNPTYGNAAASGNDVLRLTGDTPFVLALTTDNTITVDFTGLSLQMEDRLRGGFFVEEGDFLTQIENAHFQYLGLGEYAVLLSTVNVTADFGSGNVNGYVMEFTVVPEPGTWAMMLGSAALLLGLRRFRRVA